MFSSKPILYLLVIFVALFAAIEVNAQLACTLEGEPIRIGATAPLTEPGAVTAGMAMQWAFYAAEADINANCGIMVDGVQHPVEVVFADTQGLPEQGVIVAENFIHEQGVVGIVGEYHSAVALAMTEVASETNTPIIFAATYNDNITAQGLPNVFRIAPVSSMATQETSNWLINEGVKSVAIIAENTAFGTDSAAAAQAQLEAAGITARSYFVEIGSNDFEETLLSLIADGIPDAVDTSLVTGEANYTLIQQMIALGLAPTATTICIANQLAGTLNFWEAVPNGRYCIFRSIGLGPATYNATAAQLAARYRAELGGEPNIWVFEAYDSLWLMADAIQRANSTEPGAIIAALETTNFTGAQGNYYFEYTSANPIFGDTPPYLWHQWRVPAITLRQYTVRGQAPENAPIIWPIIYAQAPYRAPR